MIAADFAHTQVMARIRLDDRVDFDAAFRRRVPSRRAARPRHLR